VDVLLDAGEPSPGLVWALGRAGRAALARGLLDEKAIAGDEAVRLGLANNVLDDEEPVPTPDEASLAAVTTARDMMRVSVDARPALELASFRLLFSSGDPKEGAMAFLERREPVFEDPEER
jgi:enoyl-CoA hydratase/carnithine racemase